MCQVKRVTFQATTGKVFQENKIKFSETRFRCFPSRLLTVGTICVWVYTLQISCNSVTLSSMYNSKADVLTRLCSSIGNTDVACTIAGHPITGATSSCQGPENEAAKWQPSLILLFTPVTYVKMFEYNR